MSGPGRSDIKFNVNFASIHVNIQKLNDRDCRGASNSPLTPGLSVKHLQNLLIIKVFVVTIPFNWTG